MAAKASGRHPLESQWSVWEHHEFQKKSGDDQAYLQSMRKIFSFSTVEDFWKFWNNYPKPSEFFFDGKTKKQITRDGESKGKCVEALSIFKTGIKPEWEDPLNKIGGEWNIRKISDVKLLDQLFENALLAMVGETLDDEADVNGLRIVDKSTRRRGAQYRIELWLRTAEVGSRNLIRTRFEKSLTEGNGSSSFRSNPVFWKSHRV